METVGISASIICKISNNNGAVALRAVEQEGERILRPFGGPIRLTPAGQESLEEFLYVTEDNFASETDAEKDITLVNMPKTTVSGLTNWLMLSRELRVREMGPQRMLQEQFGSQGIDILDEHTSGLLASARYTPLGYYTHYGPDFADSKQPPAMRVVEVYEARLPMGIKNALYAANQNEGLAYFATVKEIYDRKAYDQTPIVSIARGLIDQHPHPPIPSALFGLR